MAPAETTKRRHLPLPPVMFLAVLLLVSLSISRHLLLHRGRSQSQSQSHQHTDDDALLRRLASIDVGGDQIVADAATLLSHASISSSSPTHNHHHHRLLSLHLRHPSTSTSSSPAPEKTMLRLRVPGGAALPNDTVLLTALRAALHSFLRAHQHRRRASTDIAAVMRDLRGNLGRFNTCAVVGNSGILLNSGRGSQIDAHDFIIRLNNAPATPSSPHTSDVGVKTSLTLAHSFVLHRCAAPSLTTTPGCACHPNGRNAPLLMYVSRPEHLLYALACNATATAAAPFRMLLTDARIDAVCARIAKYYSLRRFAGAAAAEEEEVGVEEGVRGWVRRRDGREPYFHYSSGLQAVVVALGVCERVDMFGFGKKAGVKHHYHTERRKETEVHDYEAEYEFYGDLQTRPEKVPFLGEAAPGFVLPPVKLYW